MVQCTSLAQQLLQRRGFFGLGLLRGNDLLLQQIEQVLAVQAADQNTIFGQGDNTGFLTDHHHDGIRIFAHAKTRAVAGTHIFAHFQVVGKRQHTPSGHNAAIPDHNSAVM